MPLKVLLLGPNGQLGHDIRSAHAALGGPCDLVSLRRETLDVSSTEAIDHALGSLQFDALVNCAAYTGVDAAEDDAKAAFAVNAHAAQAVARICADKGARLIHVSTDYVFGGDQSRRRPFEECDPIAPVNVYGASKAMGETLARIASDDIVVLRTASLFGVVGASGKGGNFIETMIRVARERRSLRVVDDQIMSPTASADVAGVVLRMLTDCCAPGIYHVVNSGSATWFEFACEIVRRAGIAADVAPCATGEYPVRAARPCYSVLGSAKAAAAFGAMPPWQDALERYLRAREHVAR